MQILHNRKPEPLCDIVSKGSKNELLLLLLLFSLRLPSHDITADGKQRRVHRTPNEQDAEVEPDARMQLEQSGTGRFDDWRIGLLVTDPCFGRGWGGVISSGVD